LNIILGSNATIKVNILLLKLGEFDPIYINIYYEILLDFLADEE